MINGNINKKRYNKTAWFILKREREEKVFSNK